jgi:hypothetical protein
METPFLNQGLRLQPSADHIQQITAVAQRNGAEQGEVLEDEVVGVQAFAKCQVFHDLSHRADAVDRGVVEDVQRGLGVDEQGRGDAVVAGERHVSVHILKPIQIEVGYTLIRRQTNWVAAVRRLANREWNRQTRRSPAHSHHESGHCGRKRTCKKAEAFAPFTGSPNPCRHVDDRRTISAIPRHEQVTQTLNINVGGGLLPMAIYQL